MYRTNDPRFRRRLNEIGQTLENANESAQSSLYIFAQHYVKPCLHSVGDCLSQCYDASCPAFPLTQRDRLRRSRGARGRAELNFDFYDDWDEDEGDGLLGGWGPDEFDRLTGGGGNTYGTVSGQQQQQQQQQPPAARRERGMTYGSGKRGRRKSIVLSKDDDPTVIPGSSKGGLFGRLFGGKPLRYKPSAAGLQEHPGQRRLGRALTEGEALLEEHEEGGRSRTHRRARSGTAQSQDTSDSYSSRGDIFPSDGEDDAIPLDDEFAMVLERRNTQSGPESESTSTGSGERRRRRGKRPSTGSRTSTRRTVSTQSQSQSQGGSQSGDKDPSADAAVIDIPVYDDDGYGEIDDDDNAPIPSLTELKQEEHRLERQEEADVARRRLEAQRLATQRGLSGADGEAVPSLSKEAAAQHSSSPPVEPGQLPTPPLDDDAEDDEADEGRKEHRDDSIRQSPPPPSSAER